MTAKRVARTSNLSVKITEGIGRLSSFGGMGLRSTQIDEIINRSSTSALKGDWERLGGDMRRAADKVVSRGKNAK